MTDGLKRQKIKTYCSRLFNRGKRKAASDSGLTNAVGDAMVARSPRLALAALGLTEPPSSTQHDDALGIAESPATIASGNLNSEFPITQSDNPLQTLAHKSSNHTQPIKTQDLNEPSLEAAGSSMIHIGGILNSGGKLSTPTSPDNPSIDLRTSRAPRTSPNGTPALMVPSLEASKATTTTTGAGILHGASNFTMNDVSLVDRSKTLNHYGLVPQADTNSKAMKQLFKNIIPNAAHDSSPGRPVCCPGTRQKVNERINSWFNDPKKQELLLWICGHAGVGKSTIVQTFAEDLEASNQLGASVFLSGWKNNNTSQWVIITIAYQLAQRIKDYRDFVAERLDLDPDLVNKRTKEQFRTFIVEPFATKVRAVGVAWGILMDGFDELDQSDQQEMIALIASFVSEHPKVPLVWVIASRPDSRIPEMCTDAKGVVLYRKEEVSADSPASHQDIKSYFQSSFKVMRNTVLPVGIVSQDWPGHEPIQKLVSAASGLFVFADAVIRFIGDPKVANPVVRLNQVLSMIDGVTEIASKPFAHLDAFYARILRSVSEEVWPTTKRVFSVLLYAQRKDLERELESLKGTSVILSLELSILYASLYKCISVMKIPRWEDVDKEPAEFYHDSFVRYLLDGTRSESFSISGDDADREVCQSLSNIWQDFRRHYSQELNSECDREWLDYCQQRFSDEADQSIKTSLLICIRAMLATS